MLLGEGHSLGLAESHAKTLCCPDCTAYKFVAMASLLRTYLEALHVSPALSLPSSGSCQSLGRVQVSSLEGFVPAIGLMVIPYCGPYMEA